MSSPARSATSADVARAAGVSRATVSYVLSGKGERFPDETRARVLAAAQSLDYRPSQAGRALAGGRSGVVVVLMQNITYAGTQLQDAVDQITESASRQGLLAVVRFMSGNPDSGVRTALDLRADAVVDFGVLSDADREMLASKGCRVVPGRSRASQVDTVDIEIGRLQVAEALRRGQRRVIYAALADGRRDPLGPVRFTGVVEEAQRLGAAAPQRVAIALDAGRATEALADVLTSGEKVAVCCYNDDVAIAVVAAARALGRRVPDDVSVVGVDNTAIGGLVDPAITTVAIDTDAFKDQLLRELETGGSDDEPVFFSAGSVRLVRRSTT